MTVYLFSTELFEIEQFLHLTVCKQMTLIELLVILSNAWKH